MPCAIRDIRKFSLRIRSSQQLLRGNDGMIFSQFAKDLVNPHLLGSETKGDESMTSVTSDQQLAYEMAKHYSDPLGFVLAAYPWGDEGTLLENDEGPDANQKQFLLDLGAEVKA